MYVCGIVLNLTLFLFLESKPFFHGYTVATWGVICCQGLLGIVVTFVLKYSDMVVRCLASACAVSVLYAINIVDTGFEFNPVYFAGAATVFLSTFLYFKVSLPEAPSPSHTLPNPKSESDAKCYKDVILAFPSRWFDSRMLTSTVAALTLFVMTVYSGAFSMELQPT